MSAIFEDRTARQRIAAELIVARIERNQRLRRLQDQAIHRADRRRFKRDMIISAVLFFATFVFVFSVIWWCGL